MAVIGFLGAGSPGGFAPFVTAFHHGLKESGYVEGQNVSIEFRWAMRSLSSVGHHIYCPEGQRP